MMQSLKEVDEVDGLQNLYALKKRQSLLLNLIDDKFKMYSYLNFFLKFILFSVLTNISLYALRSRVSHINSARNPVCV